MQILITGTNGFIGSHVANYFKKGGNTVIGLGRHQCPSENSLVDDYIQCDLNTDDVYTIPSMISGHIDAIIHLAADMRKEPHSVEVIAANCCGTQRLLNMCEENDIRTFLQLSSLPVIGHPIEHPITEDHPLNPYTIYHITKVTEELLADYAYRFHGIRTASFRISAPIGLRMNPATIFPTFVRSALQGKDIILLGKGKRKQNYLHVSDIARCLEQALHNESVHGVYNLTGNLLLSNSELAKTIIEELHSTSRIFMKGTDLADNDVWDASLQKLENDCGFIPQSTIKDMILEYATWVRESKQTEFI